MKEQLFLSCRRELHAFALVMFRVLFVGKILFEDFKNINFSASLMRRARDLAETLIAWGD
jgi:hypothetical protein